MLTAFTIWLLITSLALYGLSVTQFLSFLRYWGRFQQSPATDGELPRAGVVLCVRGCDETLISCLEGLLQQDYPDFSLSIVVDSPSDPGWDVVQRICHRPGPRDVLVSTLHTRHPECSLKCSALIQACEQLDASHRVLAFIDADVVPHSTWLRELVQPLLNARVGATTGTRWCVPRSDSLGSVIRTAWNSSMVTVMQQQSICWGGSMAIRRDTMMQIKLLERWKTSFNDDVLLGQLVRESGLELQFVPTLFMIHRERCRLPNLFDFVRRQLIHVRLTHARWPAMALLGFLAGGTIPAATALLLCGIAAGHSTAILGALATMVFFVGARGMLYRQVEPRVLRVLKQRGDEVAEMGHRIWWTIPLAATLHLTAQLGALFARQVHWRGIHYRILSGRRVLMSDAGIPESAILSMPAPVEAEIAARHSEAA